MNYLLGWILFLILAASTAKSQNLNYREVRFEVDSIVVDTVPLPGLDLSENYEYRKVYKDGKIVFHQEFYGTNKLKTLSCYFDSVAVYLNFDQSGYCVYYCSIRSPYDRDGHIYEFDRDLSISSKTEGFIVPDGVRYRYDREGNIYAEESYVRGEKHGFFKEFYKDGLIQKISKYVNGKPDGIYQEFYSNGILKSQWFYEEGELEGKDLLFDEDGSLLRIRVWNNGVMISEKYFN